MYACMYVWMYACMKALIYINIQLESHIIVNKLIDRQTNTLISVFIYTHLCTKSNEYLLMHPYADSWQVNGWKGRAMLEGQLDRRGGAVATITGPGSGRVRGPVPG